MDGPVISGGWREYRRWADPMLGPRCGTEVAHRDQRDLDLGLRKVWARRCCELKRPRYEGKAKEGGLADRYVNGSRCIYVVRWELRSEDATHFNAWGMERLLAGNEESRGRRGAWNASLQSSVSESQERAPGSASVEVLDLGSAAGGESLGRPTNAQCLQAPDASQGHVWQCHQP